MSVFFDSSVWIAAIDSSDLHHQNAFAALQKYGRQGVMACHSLAECFSTLTGKRRFTANQASELIRVNCCEIFELVELSRAEYVAAIQGAEKAGARGGAIFDMLLLAAARKSGAEKILTCNQRHFIAFAPDLANLIEEP